MEFNRRSLRGHVSCPTITNIFSEKQTNHSLAPWLPNHIRHLLTPPKTISCQIINQMPEFNMTTPPHQEVQRTEKAAQYQLEWLKHMRELQQDANKDITSLNKNQHNNLTMLNPELEEAQLQQANRNSYNLWQDEEFLQKLNTFILGDSSCRIASTQTFIERS